MNPNIFRVSDVTSTDFKPQTAKWTPFSAPIGAISHLEMFENNLE